MSKFGVYSFCVCAVCLFFVFTQLLAQEQPAIPQQILDWQKAAQSSVTQNNTAQAVEYYQKIQQTYPDTDYAADAQKQVVLAYLQTNHPDKGLTSLSEFTQKYSSQPGYIYQMGEIINRMADVNMASQAKEACLSLLDRFPDDPDMMGVMQRKARCEVMMKEPDMAAATVKVMWQKYANHPQYAYAMNWAAFEYRMAGFHTWAVELYNYLLTLDLPADIQFRCGAGLVLAEMKLGDTAAAVKEAQQVKTAILTCQNYDQAGELEEVINVLADAGQLGTSRELCQAAFEQFPDNPQILGLLQRKARYEVMMKEPDLADQTVRVMQEKYAKNSDIGSALAWTAYAYYSQGYYPQAIKLYQDIASSTPAGDIELRCRAGIVLAYLKQNDKENAFQAAQQVKAAVLTCQNYDQMVELEEIINPLADAGRPEISREICQAVVERFPDNSQLLSLLQRKARCEVMMKDPNLADATVEVMQQKCANHPQYANAMSWTAYEYCKTGFYPRAIELYNDLLSLNPAEDIQLRCKAGIAAVHVRLEEDARVREEVNYLLSYSKNDPNSKIDPNDLAGHVFSVAEEYILIADELFHAGKSGGEIDSKCQKALVILEHLLDWPGETVSVQHAWYSMGTALRLMKDYKNAAEYYQAVTDLWPDYIHGWNSQYFVGYCYEELKKSDRIDPDTADTKIEQAYKKTIEKYPNGGLTRLAYLSLGDLCLRQKRYVEAIGYYEQYQVKASPSDPFRARTKWDLAWLYDKAGDTPKSRAMYEQLIHAPEALRQRVIDKELNRRNQQEAGL